MTDVREYTCEFCGKQHSFGYAEDGSPIGYSTTVCCSFCDGRRQERALCALQLDQAAHQVEVYRRAMADAEKRARLAEATTNERT